MHECDGCKYKGEHQEMGFRAVGTCTKEHSLPDAVKAYDAAGCKFSIQKKSEFLEEMAKHTEMQDAFNECAAVLKKAAQGALNAYTTNLSFGGKPDQHEEDWIEALFCGMNSIALVEELRQRLEQVEKERDALLDEIRKCNDCFFCKYYKKGLCEEPCKTCIQEYQTMDFKPGFVWRGMCENK